MHIIAHGIDLVDCKRIAKLLARHEGSGFLSRLFTDREQDYCRKYRQPAERFGGRFAVKEAVMKALGTGWSETISWTDIETVNDGAGKPGVCLQGQAAARAAALGIERILVSITHTGDLAMASVIAVGAGEGRP